MKQTFDLLKITNTILCNLMIFKLSFISCEMTGTILNDIMLSVTLVPDVFLDISPHKRAAREPRSDEHESMKNQEKPLGPG